MELGSFPEVGVCLQTSFFPCKNCLVPVCLGLFAIWFGPGEEGWGPGGGGAGEGGTWRKRAEPFLPSQSLFPRSAASL